MNPVLFGKKEEFLDFIAHSIKDFLSQNPGLVFYAFALDCNAAEGAEVGLSFNTEEAFVPTLEYYQNGPYKERYQNENAVYELRYNPGDWEYMYFAEYTILPESDLAEMYGTDLDAQIEDIMEFCAEVLAAFMKTDTFGRIPKTDDFKALCFDHDEDVSDAEERMRKYL